MGIKVLLMGTLCSGLLQLTPANMWQSDQQLVNDSQPVITTIDFALGSTATPTEGLVATAEMVQVDLNQPRVRVMYVEEEKGNIQDGYTLHLPAPT